MKYHSFVEEYLSGQGSLEDRQAFEHELAENASLASEYEASQLVEELLSFAAAPAEVAILGDSGHSWLTVPRIAGAAILVGALSGLFTFLGQGNSSEQRSELPVLEWPAIDAEPVEIPTLDIPAFRKSEWPVSEQPVEKEPVKGDGAKSEASAPKAAPVKPKSAAKAQTAASMADQQPTQSAERLHIVTVDAVISEELPSHSDVSVTATRTITLKPGFSAGHGSAFKATINSNPFSAQAGAE